MMRSVIVLSALVALPALAAGQVMPSQVVRRAGTSGLAMSDGEPISYILEHAQVLDLVDSQRTSLIAIRRKLRAVNEPFMKQLDSLRELLGVSLEPRPRGLTDDDRKKLQRLEQLSQPVTDSIRINNDAARIEARRVLDSVQVARLDSLTVSERGAGGARRVPPDESFFRPVRRFRPGAWR